MAFPNVTGEIIAQGYNCQVRVGETPTDAEPIALVASFQANEDFQVQEAVCIGNLGPTSLDPQGYTCSITMDGFLPFKKDLEGGEGFYPEGGKISIMKKIPTREGFMEMAKIQKIAYMDFFNRKANEVLAAFKGVLISTDGISVEGNAYARNNVQARALEKIDLNKE